MSKFKRRQMDDIFLFFPEYKNWRFVQIIPLDDSLHKIVKFYFTGKIRKYFKMYSAQILAQHAKR